MNRIPKIPISIVFIAVFVFSLNVNIMDQSKQLIENVPRFGQEFNERQDLDQSEGIADVQNISSSSISFAIYTLSLTHGLLAMGFLILLYLRFINSGQLRRFISNSLKISGFNSSVPQFSRHFSVPGKISVELMGFFKLKVRITAPLYEDYQYFGLRKYHSFVLSEANLDQLQLKLMVFKEYLKDK